MKQDFGKERDNVNELEYFIANLRAEIIRRLYLKKNVYGRGEIKGILDQSINVVLMDLVLKQREEIINAKIN